ncbi:unnamed protein product, partial [Tetraodon nigroviridis]
VRPDGAGVPDADFLLYLQIRSTDKCRAEANVLAYAVHCQTGNRGRPVAGAAVICKDRLAGAAYSHQRTAQTHLASSGPELGAPLENLGAAPGRASSHWESRVLQGSIMAPVLGDPVTVRIDPVTLAALQDTGWYAVDLSRAQSLVWGAGGGNSFGSPSTCQGNSPFFCTGSGPGCHYLHLHKGACQTDPYLEGCRLFQPLETG